MEFLIKLCRRTYTEKYRKRDRNKTLYGNLYRAFTDSELALFFSHVSNHRERLAWKLMLYLGLRIGEAVKIKLEDIDWNRKVVKVVTEKTGLIDEQPIPSVFFDELQGFCQSNWEQIQNHSGYLLFSNNQNRKFPFLSHNYLRRRYLETLHSCGLAQHYAIDKKGKKLQRLSTHSFRRTYATKLVNSGAPTLLCSKLLRHTDPKTIQKYYFAREDEKTSALQKAFATIL